MTKLTIELPDAITVAMRNGASVSIESAKLATLGTELFLYGIGQKVRDAASGAAKVAKESKEELSTVAQGMMDTAVAALLAGDWSHRGEGSGVDPRTVVARSVTRQAMKAALGSKSPDWAKFTGLSDADQLAKLDENYAANESVLSDAVDKELEQRQNARKAKAKLAKAATFNI